MHLIDPTNDALDLAFAEHVAGMVIVGVAKMWVRSSDGGHDPTPKFTASLDLVLPWLQKWPDVQMGLHPYKWVKIDKRPGYMSSPPEIVGEALSYESLAKAAVIALLRANGIQVTFKTEHTF